MNFIIPNEFMARETTDPFAFVRPVLGGGMMDRAMSPGRNQPPPTWEELLRLGLSNPCVVYVNVPFCPSACSFCGFLKAPGNPELHNRYVDALIQEIEKEGSLLSTVGANPSAIFLGGGTPSFLSADNLDRLLGSLQTSLPLSSDCEITVEGRLSTLTGSKLEIIRKRGVSRLSLGVQSFNDEVRSRAGRSDGSTKIIEALGALNFADGPLAVIDLMYGLPGQSLDIFKNDLKIAANLNLPGISAYMFKLMRRSPFFADLQKGLEQPPLDTACLSKYYRAACNELGEHSYAQSSGNHWRLDERDHNIYNTLAMGRHDMLAFGAGAGGSIGAAAFANVSNIERYVAEIEAGRKPLSVFRPAPANHLILNEASRRIHKGEIDCSEWPMKSCSVQKLVRPLLEQWERAGLLVIDGQRAILNQAGIFWRGNLEFALRGWLSMNLGD